MSEKTVDITGWIDKDTSTYFSISVSSEALSGFHLMDAINASAPTLIRSLNDSLHSQNAENLSLPPGAKASDIVNPFSTRKRNSGE